MFNHQTIQVFEYEFLLIDEANGFGIEHWERLCEYNEEYGGGFFRLTHNGVWFQNYVGVIQVGNLTIEILPKIGRVGEDQKEKTAWQQVLINMLRECNWMSVYAHQKASLHITFNSILEAYLELFIKECEDLLHQGLIKKYRQDECNITSLKGKLLFSKNIQNNLVHKERFYTIHQEYDNNNLFNQILYKALKIIPQVSNSPLLKDRVNKLLIDFPELSDIAVNERVFQKIVFDRKTFAYQEAIEIAAMLLLNYRPDISSGHKHILAILFDMNDLWEEYVFRQISRYCNTNWDVVPQEYKTIWQRVSNPKSSKGVKPDIVIINENKRLIVDTKWKLPEDDIPADGDLKQMFMYNEYWEGANAVLLYPMIKGEVVYEPGQFINGGRVKETSTGYRHLCGIMKASVLDSENNLAINFGEIVNKRINKEFFQ